MDTQTRDFTEIVPEFKNKLSSHGLDTSKLDDNQWREVVSEIQPLFQNYGDSGAEGGSSYAR